MFKSQIKSWLKAGIMDSFKQTISETNEVGTPQGGVISPLLANIALHGMENAVLSQFPRNSVKIIRYADDFVITSKVLKDILKAKRIVEDFLKGINLELSDTKTRIGHSLMPMESNNNQIGFDFLGFHFRNINVSVHKGVRTRGGTQTFQQISIPSRESFLNHKQSLKKILRDHKAAPLGALIARLSSTIGG
jgi:RNA-directed DNA polymerase